MVEILGYRIPLETEDQIRMINLDNLADKRKEKFAGLKHADVRTNVGANMSNFQDVNKNLMNHEEKQRHEILTARALIRNQKEINVQLLNPNHAPIKIQKGEVIGLAYTVEETLSEEKEEVITRKLTVDSAEVEELLKTLNYPRYDTNLWRQKFEELIAEYYDIFRVPDQRLTSTTEVKHRIITEDVPPIAKRPYRVP
ncbi:hypothetical protein TcasGA2_TC008490 [Tribolium castaneum]|uniref:Uncharacterized protein n=1 Tax=Tribolium castaneum TaxID=7070 RepID=D2A2Q0_TRICA|nr:hypothetical protein TcasGA2_TC008490 [Tribolium castaneum]